LRRAPGAPEPPVPIPAPSVPRKREAVARAEIESRSRKPWSGKSLSLDQRPLGYRALDNGSFNYGPINDGPIDHRSLDHRSLDGRPHGADRSLDPDLALVLPPWTLVVVPAPSLFRKPLTSMKIEEGCLEGKLVLGFAMPASETAVSPSPRVPTTTVIRWRRLRLRSTAALEKTTDDTPEGPQRVKEVA
jgi:hypothetical protein